MADITKSVAVIFTAETGGAEAKLSEITKAIDSLGKAGSTELTGTTKGIEELGKSATGAAIGAKELGDGLKKLAEDAGVPAPVLDGLSGILSKIGSPVGGTALVAAAAIAALAITFAKAGLDADKFKTTIENVSGGSVDSAKELQFVIDVTKRVETNLNDTLEAYSRFFTTLQGSGLATKTIQQAFEGIVKAVEGVGGSSADTQKALDTFARAAVDGSIKTKEFAAIAAAIPGGLRIFAEAVDAPNQKLVELAGTAGYGIESIRLFAEALANQTYSVVGIGGVTNAFNDFFNTLKLFGLELGAEGSVGGGFWLLEKAMRGLTLVTTIGVESFKYWGETFANIVFTIRTLDFSGFLERQTGIMNTFNAGVIAAADKLTGFQRQIEKPAEIGVISKESISLFSAAADAFVGFSDQIVKTRTDVLTFGDAFKTSTVNIGGFATNLADFQQPLSGLSDQLVKSGDASLKFGEALEKGGTSTEKAVVINERLVQSNREVFAMVEETTGKLYDMTAAVDNVGTRTETYVDVTKRLAAGQKDIYEIVDASTGKIIGYEQAVGKATTTTTAATTAATKSAAELKKVEEAAAKTALELEKLASNERIKAMEFRAEINVAQIQADAEKVIATFDSINNTITSTAEVLSSVFSLFGKGSQLSSTEQNALFTQLDKENALREKAFELQKSLTEAQIESMRATTQALIGGDALIKIDGAGLQPQLEAFMWEILKAIQVRVNRDGLKLLLGVN